MLQALGAYLVHHFLRGDSVYGVFATVLGLLAWIYLAVAMINVVLARQLWPRSIVQRRSPKPTGPSWRLRHGRTSDVTTSTWTCPSMTSHPTPGPAEESPMRTRRSAGPRTRACRALGALVGRDS